jgi:hypothetical protein
MAHHKKYHVHHRRNPLGVSGADIGEIAWVSAGYVAGRAIPAMLLSGYNSGVVGYLLNAGTGVALKMVVGGSVGHALLIGGIASAVTRLVSDQFGANIKGLSGDPAFTLGAYWNSYFAVPTVSDPYGRVAASPYPQPVMAAPATVKGYMGAAGARAATTFNRFAGRFQ